MIFEEPCSFQFNDYLENKQIKLMSILYQFESLGTHHSEYVGDYMDDRMADGEAWIQLAWQFHIHRRPVYREAVRASTWVTGKGPSMTLTRSFQLADEQGTRLVTAEAAYSIYNWQMQQSVHIGTKFYDMYQPEEERFYKRRLPRLRAPETWARELRIPLRRSDLDYNGHVHNTYYLNLALESIDEKDYWNAGVSDVTLLYHAPLKEGDTAVVRCQEINTGYLISISNQEDTLCTLVQLTR